jgi:hypothetical protein
MKRRTKAQWLSLIKEFENSGLSQVRFCAERGLNPKYFSLRRAKLKAAEQHSSFIEALPAQSAPSGEVVIQYGPVSIQVAGGSTQAIAQLVKALAA